MLHSIGSAEAPTPAPRGGRSTAEERVTAATVRTLLLRHRRIDINIVNGNGADTDIVVASAKAYINALNLMREGAYRAHPQAADV